MDNFPEQIMALSKRALKVKESIATEEATKTSLVMPFFQLLNYDVFNPEEFVPEYVADVGIKKGEKVDYAILKDGVPVILIEAKSVTEQLKKHDSQLFRYFVTTKAKFAILTNGIHYRFYTDLEEQNKMDSVPFFEFNLLDIREQQIVELSKFKKNMFNIDSIITTASELKYTSQIKNFLKSQWDKPSDDFIKLILTDIYQGTKTRQVIDKFSEIVKKSLKEYVNDLLNDRLKAAIMDTMTEPALVSKEADVALVVTEPPDKGNSNIITTEDEIEAFITIKVLLSEVISPKRVTFRDRETYFTILIDDNARKWICRLELDRKKKTIRFNDVANTAVLINSVSDIILQKEKLIQVASTFI